MKCRISYVALPITIREAPGHGRGRSSSSKGRDGKGRGRRSQTRRVLGRGLRLAASKKKGELTKAIVYRKWPVMLLSDMALALMSGGASHLLILDEKGGCLPLSCDLTLLAQGRETQTSASLGAMLRNPKCGQGHLTHVEAKHRCVCVLDDILRAQGPPCARVGHQLRRARVCAR